MKFIRKLFGRIGPSEENKQGISETIFGATDVGLERDHNEDFFLIRPEKDLYIVADGMGGYNAGEVASFHATEAVDAYFTLELLSELRNHDEMVKEEMTKGLLEAHEKVFDLAKSNEKYRGMGCTIVVALIEQNNLHISHVGDARAYVCDDVGLHLLTTDHSSVMELVKAQKMTMEEARVSPIKNEITQAIGAPRPVVPEYDHYTLKDGDKVLLCSDGLWDMLMDEQIYEIIKQEKPVKILCEQLIKMANEAGGHDNITVVVIEYRGDKIEREEEGPDDLNTRRKPA